MYESEKNILLCVAVGGGGGLAKKRQFFSTCEKIIQFLEFWNYQGGKTYVKTFGILLQ